MSEQVWDLYEDGVTQSFIGTFKSCRERAKNAYFYGLRKESTGIVSYMEYGNLFHFVKEKFNKLEDRLELLKVSNRGDMQKQINKIVNTFNEELFQKVINSQGEIATYEAISKLCHVAKNQLFQYFDYWREDFLRWKWISLERTFDVPYISKLTGKTIPLKGKIDGELDEDGFLFLFETKTKSDINLEKHLLQLEFDFQVAFYQYAQSIFHDGKYPSGFMYNLVRRPALRLKDNETFEAFGKRVSIAVEKEPESYFQKVKVLVPSFSHKEFIETELHPVMAAIEEWYLDMPKHNFRNSIVCNMYNRPCAFLELCGKTKQRSDYKVEHTVFGELHEDDSASSD